MSSRSLSQAAPCDRVAADKAADVSTGDDRLPPLFRAVQCCII